MTITVPDEIVNSLFWVLTAYSADVPSLESEPSNEVYLNMPAVKTSDSQSKSEGGCFVENLRY